MMTIAVRARRRPWLRPVALLLLGLAMLTAMLIVILGLPMVPGEEGVGASFIAFLFLGLWLYLALGVVVVLRADGHTVGWLFAIAAPVTAWVFACYAMGYVLTSLVPPHPAGGLFNLAGGLLFNPAIILLLPAVALVFPTGTLPGPRWRGPVAVVLALMLLRAAAVILKPGPMGDGGPPNPLTPWLAAIPSGVVDVLGLLEAIGSLSILLGAGLGVAALLVRARWSRGVERQQLKWLVVAMVPAAILLPLSLQPAISAAVPVIGTLSVATLPLAALAVAVAVLRYRLYDIDRILSRTIGWAIVTIVLGSVFGVAVVGLQGLLAGFTQGDTLAIAASTLVAASLFQPLRRRVQRAVDRRFDRARYDGEQTAEVFAARLRDQVDLDGLQGDIVRVVRESMRPGSASVWIRGSRR